MEKLGVVTKTNGNYMDIKVHRDSACGENCAACGLCQNREMTITLKNTGGFLTGDEVRLLSEDKRILKFSALGYLSLTLLLLLGGAVGTALGSEWLAFILAAIFLFAGVFVLRKISPKSVEIIAKKITR